MKYYVLYKDDYADNDGIGWECFDLTQDALDFIQSRMNSSCNRTLDKYKLIEAKELFLIPKDVIKTIAVKE